MEKLSYYDVMLFGRKYTFALPVRILAARGFTLVEMLLVVAVISVMSALVVTAVSNAAGDARLIVARQQQAVLQEALNAWISRESVGTNGLAGARATYTQNSANSAKLALLVNYLDSGTYSNFSTNSGGSLKTDDMQKIGKSLTFTAWTLSNYPRVEMQ